MKKDGKKIMININNTIYSFSIGFKNICAFYYMFLIRFIINFYADETKENYQYIKLAIKLSIFQEVHLTDRNKFCI